MTDGPTHNTKVLMSFGSLNGGFEFAYQLRWDIYKKFKGAKCNPDTEPDFVYLDAETLRTDPKTTYNFDAAIDKKFMNNTDWDQHYEAAMSNCKTMLLLLTKEWLTSKWCWHELDMLVRIAEKRPDMKVIAVMWPDGKALLLTDKWQQRQKNADGTTTDRTPKELYDRLKGLKNPKFYYPVAGDQVIVGAVAKDYVNMANQGTTTGTNLFAYSCTQAETTLILANVDA